MAITITEGTFHIFTYKEGLLSALGHDLRLRCERFEIAVEGDRITGRFEAASVHCDGSKSGNGYVTHEPGDKDKREIKSNIDKKVLEVSRYPEILYQGQAARKSETRITVDGKLSLVGTTLPLQVEVTQGGGRLKGELNLVPSRFGIKPFKAALGALRIQDRVVIEFDFPDPGEAGG